MPISKEKYNEGRESEAIISKIQRSHSEPELRIEVPLPITESTHVNGFVEQYVKYV